MRIPRKFVLASVRVALGFALCLSLAQISPAQGATNFQSSGAAASWNVYSIDGSASFSGEVFTNSATNQDTQTFLVMDFATQTPSTLVEVSGFGMIPSHALQGDSIDHMSLNLDLSQVTGFTSCTTDYTNNKTQTCTDSPAGTISIQWKRPSFAIVETSESFSRNKFEFGNMTMTLMGQYDNTNAPATATAFGVSFPPGSGEIGTSRQMVLTIQRK